MATLVVADDDRAIRKIVRDRLTAAGHAVEVAENGREALPLIERVEPDVVLLDLRMPELDGFGVLDQIAGQPGAPSIIVITAHGSIEAAVRAMKAGAYDFLQKPFEAAHLEHVVAKALEAKRLRRDVGLLRGECQARHQLVPSASSSMREVERLAERAARSDATVLLTGESGTGKEVLARALHAASHRADGPFVAVNCAALSAELLESELFGHEKGAFTGAVRTKPGRLELAAGGSLFLDEIGELRPALQAKLLRVLQEREFERVGGTRTLKADVRVVAATNRDLETAVARGEFRQDLYYRLKVVALRLPALRDRREDIRPLALHFLARFAHEGGRANPRLDDGAAALLEDYAWPGNVRELANALERAVVLGAGDAITADDLPEELHERVPATPTAAAAGANYHDAVAAAKRAILRDALRAEGGHQTRAARRLGLTQPYLARLMKNLGVRPGDEGPTA
jgi:DNA-binding NtrC family response regulator